MSWRDLRHGERPTSRQLNDLAGVAEREIVGANGVPAVAGPDGVFLSPSTPRVNARLTGSSGAAYAWTEVYYDVSSSAWADVADGRTGTTSALPARERSGATTVATGTRAELALDPSGDFYLFDAPSGSTSGSAWGYADVQVAGVISVEPAATQVLGEGSKQARGYYPDYATYLAGTGKVGFATLDVEFVSGAQGQVTAGVGTSSFMSMGVNLIGSTYTPFIRLYLGSSAHHDLLWSYSASGGYYTIATANNSSLATQIAAGRFAIANASGSVTDTGGTATTGGLTFKGGLYISGSLSGVGTVTSVSGTSGNITSTGGATPVINLATTAVTPGSYGPIMSIQVDAYGRITSAATSSPIYPAWTKYVITHSGLAVASTTNTITLDTLAAKTVIHGVILNATVAFTGGAITDYAVRLKVGGTFVTAAKSVFSTPASDQAAWRDTGKPSGALGYTAFIGTTSFELNAVSTTANLDAATAGNLDVWILTSVLQ